MSEIEPEHDTPDPPEDNMDAHPLDEGPAGLGHDAGGLPDDGTGDRLDGLGPPVPMEGEVSEPGEGVESGLEEALSSAGPLALAPDAAGDAELAAWLAEPAPDPESSELHELDLRLRERLSGQD